MPALIATSAAVVCIVMATEIVSYLRFGTEIPIPLFAIVGVTVTLGIACLACMVAALVPGRDPLGLSEQASSYLRVRGRGSIAANRDPYSHLDAVAVPWAGCSRFGHC